MTDLELSPRDFDSEEVFELLRSEACRRMRLFCPTPRKLHELAASIHHRASAGTRTDLAADEARQLGDHLRICRDCELDFTVIEEPFLDEQRELGHAGRMREASIVVSQWSQVDQHRFGPLIEDAMAVAFEHASRIGAALDRGESVRLEPLFPEQMDRILADTMLSLQPGDRYDSWSDPRFLAALRSITGSLAQCRFHRATDYALRRGREIRRLIPLSPIGVEVADRLRRSDYSALLAASPWLGDHVDMARTFDNYQLRLRPPFGGSRVQHHSGIFHWRSEGRAMIQAFIPIYREGGLRGLEYVPDAASCAMDFAQGFRTALTWEELTAPSAVINCMTIESVAAFVSNLSTHEAMPYLDAATARWVWEGLDNDPPWAHRMRAQG